MLITCWVLSSIALACGCASTTEQVATPGMTMTLNEVKTPKSTTALRLTPTAEVIETPGTTTALELPSPLPYLTPELKDISHMIQVRPQSELTPSPPSSSGVYPTPELREAIYVVEIAPQLPRYIFRLIPDLTATELPRGRYLVGRIQVSQEDSDSILQTIPVEMDGPGFLSYLVTEDINFDGYLDIAVYQIKGSKWGRFYWWLFDVDSKSFYSNSLTEELEELGFNCFFIDPQAQQIHTTAFIGVCPCEYTYQIANGHLTLVFAREYDTTQTGCVRITGTLPP